MLKSLWVTSRWGLVPILLGIILAELFFVDFQWNNELFHVALEGGGAIIAFILSYLIFTMINRGRLTANYYWLVLSFSTMGVLDLTHSQVPPGQSFVWLHSCATFLGGIFAALVWFSPIRSKRIFNRPLIPLTLILIILFSLISITFPDVTLDMLDEQKQFTENAAFLNLSGGIGFAISWGYFVKQFHFNSELSSTYFSNNAILLSLAALLFQLSILWDANWWLWHMMRAVAYSLLFFYFAGNYFKDLVKLEQANQTISNTAKNLEKEILERKTAEDKMKAFKIYAEASTQGMGWSDISGNIQYMNPALKEILQESNETSFLEENVITRYYPEEEQVRLSNEIFPCIMQHETWSGELTLKRKSGELVPTENHLFLIRDGNGSPIYIANLVQDISARKVSEEKSHRYREDLEEQVRIRTQELEQAKAETDKVMERLNTAMVATEDGIWDWNIVTSDVFYNPAWQEMLGYKVGEIEQNVKAWTKILHPDDLQNTIDHAQKFINNQSTEYRMEFRLLCKDGSYKWVLARATDAERDEKGIVTRIIGTHVDIHDRKQLEFELIKAKEIAEAANQAKSEFLSNMSHEIRTPMNAIIGMSGLALQTDLNDKQKNYINKVSTSAENLLIIINDILDFSKIEAGKLDIESSPFLLKEVISNMVTIIKLKTEEKSLQLSIKINRDVPKYLIGDPLRISQILINIANNAVKFTDEGGSVSLLVELKEENDSDAIIKFSIKDTGIGLNTEQQGKLFKAFSQADTSTTRKYGGTGLGLVISSQLVQLMEGKLWVESEEGKGSNFCFTIRIDKQTDEIIEKNNTLKISHETIDNSLDILKGKKILLVEDNEINQELAKELLLMNGMIIHTADNGQEAVNILKKQEFDGVLMDCQMPVMDGYEACRCIRSSQTEVLNHEIPIIAMTANAMKQDVEKSINSGMNDHIAKPINPDTMIITMARWIK